MKNEFLPFALPDVGEAEINEVADAMRSGWLTTGPKTRRFEQEFGAFLGARHALAVNSATAGLHLALEAIGIGPGDKVATTAYTFTATAEVVRYLGADPVFVDIDPETLNIDPAKLEQVVSTTPEIKAVIPVHFAGQACEMDEILALASSRGLKVVEDAAHAIPATYKGRQIGTLGDLTVFSFYATKTIATGEGGMVVTDDDACCERIKTMRLHGINRDAFDRYSSSKPSWYYEIVAPGFKYNMTDIASSIGIHQLARSRGFQQRRAQIAAHYTERLRGLPVRTPYVRRPDDVHSWHLYVLQLELENLKIDRQRFIELMCEAGIGTSVHFIPLHIQPYWRDRYRLGAQDFPVSLGAYQRAVSLPIYTKMTDEQVERVAQTARQILEQYRR